MYIYTYQWERDELFNYVRTIFYLGKIKLIIYAKINYTYHIKDVRGFTIMFVVKKTLIYQNNFRLGKGVTEELESIKEYIDKLIFMDCRK